MRRADRLFLIIHALRGRRTALPARGLAETLGVSQRTVYRDVADLQLSGIPIEGEAGIGYVLRKGADIPPLMFNADELEALVVGTRFVKAFAGARLHRGAQAALLKIEAVLPPELKQRASRSRIYAPARWHEARSGLIDRLHEAIANHQVLRLDYRDEAGRESAREVEPLCLAFWGGVWTLGTWCRLRTDFRNFRPDRITQFVPTGECFDETPERGLSAYLRAVGGEVDGID
ncbi:YafY family protein [Dokdonella sp.]|uniref:helix-turn-helix transcriptional regulator n=1 Tax=Dokdonella sp. TaxID=2291710 RepID=UPI0026343E45|nr:YafY family protein [Dokdonella sp.]